MALLPQDPQKQKLILIGLLPILLAFGYYYFFHTKRVEDLQRLMVADLIGVPVIVRLLRAGRLLEVELTPAELG